MDSSELSEAAWDLVEHCRKWLNISELNTAFVRLGVGEYNDAMAIALKSALRAGESLPAHLLARLTALAQVYYFDEDLAGLLTTVDSE
ncbi:hypothetical protein JN086_05505 [Mycolicibacterium austroafricanum]|nr:hypothetical protein C6A88_20665 [Mycolicibacterium austroafricanum]QRZ07815.1 hypothetical protein JN090_04500 [Mycolicibacterium austroafricanum]QZT63208.1 hypothetical protein JN085_02025 [Mycolicibacterium austroafricanum]QZT69478.1 hypothetical protein JN086_05505 [Mycolicibacterium austroafricanum]